MALNTQKISQQNKAKFDAFSSGQITSNSLSFISAFLFYLIHLCNSLKLLSLLLNLF